MKKLAYLMVLLAACAKTDSSDVLTSGIYAGITASSTGDGTTRVSATLYLGDPINLSFVELTGDDRLVARSAGEEKTMVETEILNAVSHHASFSTDAAGAQFEVAFLRTVDGGAPSSVATLPEKLTLGAAPASASRAEPLTLTWSPAASADMMSWQVEGDCVELEFANVTGDPGSATIPANAIRKRMGEMIADTCAINVTIKRSRTGRLDPGYGKGGKVSGEQVRTVMLTSTP